jgi:hypothetical protein
MRIPFIRMLLLASLLLSSCSDDPLKDVIAQKPPPEEQLPVHRDVNQFLLDVAREHGLPARVEGDWVAFDGSAVRMNGGVALERSGAQDRVVVQIDFRVRLPDGRLVVQPVIGWDKDRLGAIASAQASFLIGTYHAMLGAFIDPGERHVETSRQVIGGRERVLTFGDTLTKVLGGDTPPTGGRWKEQLMTELGGAPIPAGTHWVDVYNGFVDDKQELEIQLDSQRWPEMEQKMRGADWPRVGHFTSVREFIIIQDVNDPTRPKARPQTAPAATAPAAT